MDSVYAIGLGLVLRLVVDAVSDDNVLVAGVIIGLWEGVVVHHFLGKMPRSPDPYLAFGVRLFIDFLMTESLSRMAMVVVWAGLGALLADVAPGVYRDSGFRYLSRSIRRDVRSIQRSVTLPSLPDVRIKNDLPRLFSPSRVHSTVTSPRSTRIPVVTPAPAPTPGPPRRQGRSPPGTFPGASGWSETDVDISRGVTSPSNIPSHVDQELEYLGDQTYIRTPQPHRPILPIPPMDSGSNLFAPMAAAAVGLGATMLPSRPGSTIGTVIPNTDRQRTPTHANSSLYPAEASLIGTADNNPDHLPTPKLDTLSSIPDDFPSDPHPKQPHQYPLPETRAGSVVGSVFETRSTFGSKELLKGSMLLQEDTIGEQSEQRDTKTTVADETIEPSSSAGANVAQGATSDISEKTGVEKTKTKEEPTSSSQFLPAQSGEESSKILQPAMSMPEPVIPNFPPAEPADQPDPGPSGLDEDCANPDSRPPPPAYTDVYVDEEEQNETQNETNDPKKSADQPNENCIMESELEEGQRDAMVKRRAFLKRQVEKQRKVRDEIDKDHHKIVKTNNTRKIAAVKERLDEAQKKLDALEAKADKKVYLVCAPPSNEPTSLTVQNMEPSDAVATVSNTITTQLLKREDANPLVFHFIITPAKKVKQAALVLRTTVISELEINFSPRFDTSAPGTVIVTV